MMQRKECHLKGEIDKLEKKKKASEPALTPGPSKTRQKARSKLGSMDGVEEGFGANNQGKAEKVFPGFRRLRGE